MDRLYVVVRGDLSPGDTLCQATHAAVEWVLRYMGQAARWRDHGGNNLVILAVPDEAALVALHAEMEAADLRSYLMREPDLADAATAFAVDARARRRLSNLPLAMRERAMA